MLTEDEFPSYLLFYLLHFLTERPLYDNNFIGGIMFENLGVGELLVLLFFLLPIIFWVFALIDILKNNFQDNNKIIWVLVVIFLPIIGAVLYFIIGKKQKMAS
jgi:hypothetical protein